MLAGRLRAAREPGLAEENLQARIRGTILMALSNKFGWLVLTTGNKSEMATGYATLYGDMAGGFAVIKDVPKTLVYDAVATTSTAGPAATSSRSRASTKPPSAELRPDQNDTDSLPPVRRARPDHRGLRRGRPLDRRADRRRLRRDDRSARVAQLIDRNEYKRRQAPPGVRVTRPRRSARTAACPSPTAGRARRLAPRRTPIDRPAVKTS